MSDTNTLLAWQEVLNSIITCLSADEEHRRHQECIDKLTEVKHQMISEVFPE